MAEEPQGKCGMCTNIIISTKVHDEACFYHKRAHNFGKHQGLCTDTSHVLYRLPTAPRYILILMCLPHGLLRLKNHLGFQLQRIK